MARRGSTHRLMRWLWTSRRLDARLARLALLPAAGLWRGTTLLRDSALRRTPPSSRSFDIPVIALGNLTVGGSGKAPVLAWLARHLGANHCRPGIALLNAPAARAAALGHAAPEAMVRSGGTPMSAVDAVRLAGADVALLDTSLPWRGPRADFGIAVIGAETGRAVRWPLPAGPWRESWRVLGQADAVIVTRRRATAEAAADLAARLASHTRGPIAIAHLGVRHLEGLVSRTEHPASALAGRRVVAASASADPGAFVAQVKAAGAAVQVAQWEAADDLRDEDVAWLAHAARRADFVVISEQDAVRLRDRWPARVAEPLVAVLDLTWEQNGEPLLAALDAAVASAVDR